MPKLPPLFVALAGALLLALAAAGADPGPGALEPERAVDLRKGDRVCLLGNALAERMQHHGWLETHLQLRLPEHGLSFRNLGFSADELTVHQRTMNFGKMPSDTMQSGLANNRFVPWDRYLDRCDASVVFAFFGYNESFAGRDGIDGFRGDLESFVDHVLAQRYDGEAAPRLVLFSSIPHEDLGDPNLPDGAEHNARIRLYSEVTAAVAREKGVAFVDLYGPMTERYAAAADPLTINGIHLTEEGNHALADVITEALTGGLDPIGTGDPNAVREAVLEKNLLWFNRYRATDGYNTYGGRSREVYPRGPEKPGVTKFSNYDVLQREMEVLDVQCANRDRRIQGLARGVDEPVDDSNAPPLIPVITNKPGRGPEGSHIYLGGREAREKMTPAPGMRIEVFADERQFPELVNPVQMAWDTRGRLWVAAWPTYPKWTPGQPMNDKLLILEDTDGDGRADVCKPFADDLHNPTGFEFWNGGVVVANPPDLLFLEDTDGDDRVDRRERLLHGLSSGDTHHSANSFVLGPGGALYFQEGTFHQSQVESIHGPVRNHNGCVWRFDPRTWLVERYVPYNFANPHGHVFDRWGQDFVTDGTGNVNYYALPFSGYIQHPAKHSGYFPFFRQRSRPCGATEILSSRHFPEENQGNYMMANVIGFHGIFQYEVLDDDSGFGAQEVDPVVQSTDLNFRPVDLEMGPDGALYIADWHNAIIGHLQHHIRDPSRDAIHGRIYRVTYEGRDLLDPVAIADRPIDELLELLKEPENRTRYRTRIELSGRDSDVVVARAKAWVEGLDATHPDHEHHLLEALWLHQQHNRMDRGLLVRLLRADDPRARAAATRVLRYMRGHLAANDAAALLTDQARDEHPRVRLEAVVGASFFQTAEAASAALETLRFPTDRFLDYAMRETMRALEPVWKDALRQGQPIAADNPEGIEYLLGRVSANELVNLPPVPSVLRAVLTRGGVDSARRAEAAAALAERSGATTAAVVLEAIRSVDAGSDGHANHVLHDLGQMVAQRLGAPDGPTRDDLVALATEGKRSATRSLGFSALMRLDGSTEPAWEVASESHDGLHGLLTSVPFVQDPGLRGELYERIRPLMFAPPSHLAADAGGSSGAGTGVTVEFYEPATESATLESFAARSPKETLHAPNFTLDLAPAKRADSFGLVFRGTIYIPKDGRYTFYTNSDDGSRLFIDGTCVVNNDGAHGMKEVLGRVQLAAGPHPIVVTFYEQGGAEGLVVSWNGPGFKKQRIPDNVLGTGGADTLRSAAIRAMAHVPGHDEAKLRDAARLLGDSSLLASTVELVRRVPDSSRGADRVPPVLDTLTAYIAGLSTEHRTAPHVVAALDLGRELTDALPADEAEAAKRQLDGLGGTIVLVRTLPHQMRYDLAEFWVEAGKPVAILFQNNDVMPHNLVVTAPGALEEVGNAAERLGPDGGEGPKAFVPEVPTVLWHTGLLNPGESERLTFDAPTEPGAHPFVCTFPGHWRVMNGVMHVVEELDESVHVARRTSDEAPAPAREFVANWTVDDLAPALEEGWERGRSIDRGRALFTEAGCIKCHTLADGRDQGGAIGGPELTAVADKYCGKELLRHILEPSAEVLEGYEIQYFELDGEPDLTGRVIQEDANELHVVEALLEPDDVTIVPKDIVLDQWDTKISAMPTGLLVTLSQEEILDLLAYIESHATGDH